jgi:hypothetical protein
MSCHTIIKGVNHCAKKKVKPIFSAYNTTDQNLTETEIPGNSSSSSIVVNFNAVVDTLSTYNGSISEYTIPCSGNYQINVSINYKNIKTSEFVVTQTPIITCNLMRNNSSIFTEYGQIECPISNSISKKNGLSFSVINSFNKDDKVKVEVFVTNIALFSDEVIKVDSIYLIDRNFSGYKI